MSTGGPPVKRVDEHYLIKEQIGSGGFSTVWRAEDQRGGPDIAVKIPKVAEKSDNNSTEISARFKQEYDSYSRFEAAPLPSSIARFVTGNRSNPAYIGMEFVRGSELGNMLTSGDIQPSIQTARTYGLPIVRALAYLHHNNTCHLDCKPDNIMVRERTKRPALIDFNTVSATSEAGGTLFYEDGYKAPEQTPTEHRDKPVGPWSDVYAVGKLLCYLISGETRKVSETPSQGLDPTEIGGSCPSMVARIIQQATCADYTKRQDDCHYLMTRLLDALDESTMSAELTDTKTGKRCIVRPGDTIGRITDESSLASITVEDSERHVSPIQFQCEYDDGWQLADRSLNGTFLNINDEWVFLLSDGGFQKLSEVGHDKVSDGKPYTGAKIIGPTIISPVDKNYPLSLEFSPTVE